MAWSISILKQQWSHENLTQTTFLFRTKKMCKMWIYTCEWPLNYRMCTLHLWNDVKQACLAELVQMSLGLWTERWLAQPDNYIVATRRHDYRQVPQLVILRVIRAAALLGSYLHRSWSNPFNEKVCSRTLCVSTLPYPNTNSSKRRIVIQSQWYYLYILLRPILPGR